MIYTKFGAKVHSLAKTDDPRIVNCTVEYENGDFTTRLYYISELLADEGSKEIMQELEQ